MDRKNIVRVVVVSLLFVFVFAFLFVFAQRVDENSPDCSYRTVPTSADLLGSHEVLSDYIEFTVIDDGVSGVSFQRLDGEVVEAEENDHGNLYFGTMDDGVIRVSFDDGEVVDVIYHRVRPYGDGIAVPEHLDEFTGFEYQEVVEENSDTAEW